MLLYSVPSVEEIARRFPNSFTELIEQSLRLALDRIEEELKVPLKKQRIAEVVEPTKTLMTLSHYPILEIDQEPSPHETWDHVDTGRGLVFGDFQQIPRKVTYLIGYQEGTLPTPIQVLITMTVEEILTGVPTPGIESVKAIVRELRSKILRDRNFFQATGNESSNWKGNNGFKATF